MKKTLFVGIGGFGGKVLASIRELVKERSHTPENYMFLALDRDVDDLRSLEEQGIQCALMRKDDYYGALIARHPEEEKITKWFPVAPEFVDSRRHIGNNRACSRFDFMSTANAGFSKYLEYLLYVHSPKNGEEYDLRVVIVASLAGSTGSGMFIPAALRIKKTAWELFDADAQICGFFAGPQMFAYGCINPEKEEALMRRKAVNAIASLRELDYLDQVRMSRRKPPEEVYLDGLQGNKRDPIFQHIYWYDRSDTPEGKQMDAVQHIVRMARLAHTRYDSAMTEQMDVEMGKNPLVQQGYTACFALDEDTSKARETFRFAQEDSCKVDELPILSNHTFLEAYRKSCLQALNGPEQNSGPHMDKRMLKWLNRRPAPQPQPGPKPGVQQTVFIGLGALSSAVIFELKNLLGEQTHREEYHYVTVDTDPQDLRSMKEEPGLEVVDLSVQLPPKEYPKTDRVRADFEKWFPQKPQLTHTLDFVKGHRLYGRLAFAWAMQENRLKALEEKLYATYASGEESLPNVVVISSLVGNTGSGMFIHMALWLKQIFRRRYGKELKVNGFFIGPDVMIRSCDLYTDRSYCERLAANTMASLRELDWLTRLKLGEAVPAEPMSLEGLFCCTNPVDRQRIYDYVTYYDADPEQSTDLLDQVQQMAKCIIFRHVQERVLIESLLHGDLRGNHEGCLMVPITGNRSMKADYRRSGPGAPMQDCPAAKNESILGAYRNSCARAEAEGSAGPHIDQRWVRWIGLTE